MDASHQAKVRIHTPSLINFDKPKGFMEDVKVLVTSQITEEQNRKLASPSWVWKAQEHLNHTGEQPLIVQKYLSPNRREQEDGVLPPRKPAKGRFLSKSAGCNDSRYHRSVQPHPFLAATADIPNYRCSISDYKHGRPTRTSLLRAKKRHPSAPSVRATIEARTDNNLQKNIPTGKSEGQRSTKTPCVNTTNGETLHQFLVGARYNRGNYHDAKCLSKLGLYVCRNDTANCFMQTSDSHDQISSRDLVSELHSSLRGRGLTSRRPSSHGSIRNPLALSKNAPNPCEQISSPKTGPPTPSGEMGIEDFDHTPDTTKPTSQRMASNLKSGGGVAGDVCVLCQSGIPLKVGGSPAWSKSERRKFDPAKRWAGRKQHGGVEVRSIDKRHHEEDAGRLTEGGQMKSSDVTRKAKEVQHMVFQQYHLRIMGKKVGAKCGGTAAPRSGSICQNNHKVVNSPRAKSATAMLNDNNNNECTCRRPTEDDARGSGGVPCHISVLNVVAERNLCDEGGDCCDSDQPLANEGDSVVLGGGSADRNLKDTSSDAAVCEGEHVPINIEYDDEECDDR